MLQFYGLIGITNVTVASHIVKGKIDYNAFEHSLEILSKDKSKIAVVYYDDKKLLV